MRLIQTQSSFKRTIFFFPVFSIYLIISVIPMEPKQFLVFNIVFLLGAWGIRKFS